MKNIKRIIRQFLKSNLKALFKANEEVNLNLIKIIKKRQRNNLAPQILLIIINLKYKYTIIRKFN